MNIQDEAYSEALAEIKRLKGEIERMTEQAMHFRDMAERQGYLLTRAADRLETSAGGLDQEYVRIFIAELRKAAE